MPMNTTSLIAGMFLARNKGLPQDEAVRFGAIAGFMPPTAISLFAIDRLAQNRADEIAPPPPRSDGQTGGQTVPVTSLIGLPVGEAVATLRMSNLEPHFAENQVVVDQDPKPTPEGDKGVPEGTAVKLTVGAPIT